MALNIKHPEADRLARELAAKTGESLTDAVVNALRERLDRERGKQRGEHRVKELLREARRRISKYPVLDSRSAEDILGYDENGVPR